MLTLIDGPCEGSYACKNAPLYLRAVVDGRGEKDVLDMPTDTPKKTEKIHVYKREGMATRVHISMTKRSESGWYAVARYRYLPDVDGEQLRHDGRWRLWCREQPE